MSTLSKEQIERLTPEQQEDLAALQLRLVANRERLVKRARGSKISLGVQGACLAVAFFEAVLNRPAAPLLAALFLLVVASYWQMIATNRRIDALCDLYQKGDSDAA